MTNYFMGTDLLEKLKQLPPDKQQEVDDFINFLLNKYAGEKINGESIAEKRKRNAGRMEGKIWMADDFNDTPEDFKDYM